MSLILSNNYKVGNWSVPWIVAFGSSDSYYKADQIHLYLEDGRLEIVEPELIKRIETISQQQSLLAKIGKDEFHDGPTLALMEVEEAELGDNEVPILRIHLKRSGYFNFMAIVSHLDEEFSDSPGQYTTLRKKYVTGDYRIPVPQLAPVFAIQMSLITSDGYFMVTRRASKGVTGYRNHLAPAVNESLHALKDYIGGNLSIVATTIRAAIEELNLEIDAESFKFFTLGVDEQEYMYTLTGVIELSSHTAEQLFSHLALGTKGNREVAGRYFLGPDLHQCAKQMSELSADFRWAPYGVVCLTQAMIYKFGLNNVNEALKKYPRRD